MNENSNSLIYTIVKESIIAQLDQRRSLESKASTLTAFAGGMFALLMGARDSLILLPKLSQSLVLFSIVLFSISVLLCTIVSWVRRYFVFPNLDVLASKYLLLPENKTKLQLISNMKQEWNDNSEKLERIAWFLRIAFLSQTIAFILLGLSLYLSIT